MERLVLRLVLKKRSRKMERKRARKIRRSKRKVDRLRKKARPQLLLLLTARRSPRVLPQATSVRCF